MKPHQNLMAWRQRFDFVKTVYKTTETFPVDERFGLISQIRRTAVSVPVNIAEGAARKGRKEFIQFLYISLGSMTELDTLVLLSSELGFISKAAADALTEQLDTIGKLILGLIRKLQREIGEQ
jgi:four helix bundle protein